MSTVEGQWSQVSLARLELIWASEDAVSLKMHPQTRVVTMKDGTEWWAPLPGYEEEGAKE